MEAAAIQRREPEEHEDGQRLVYGLLPDCLVCEHPVVSWSLVSSHLASSARILDLILPVRFSLFAVLAQLPGNDLK